MKRTIVIVAAGVMLMTALALCQRSGDRQEMPQRDGVFIHLTKGPEDAHAVTMAFQMANLMAADRDVLVYCDIKAINAILKNSPDITFHTFDSSHTQIKALLDKSVPVYACPACLKALGKNPEDLMAGVRVAEKDAFFSFTRGRILTLDY